MRPTILLTSFDTWLPHHRSNASDDLLAMISSEAIAQYSLTFLRKLPVDFELAPQLAIAKIRELDPQIIVCCGMAESRQQLTVEIQATHENHTLQTSVNLQPLIAGLSLTQISRNAGRFVCEKLYYSVLHYLRDRSFSRPCIFVHVPRLHPHNSEEILCNFITILQRLTHLSHPTHLAALPSSTKTHPLLKPQHFQP